MDSTYSFDTTAIVLSFAITTTIACVFVIGISIYILFWERIPFYGFTKVFIVIAYGVYITFAVSVFIFLEIARKQHGTRQKFENISLVVMDCALEMVIFLFVSAVSNLLLYS